MSTWTQIGTATTSDGDVLILRQQGGAFELRMNGHELMTTRAHGSEEVMARLARHRLRRAEAPSVLIGGLGIGYTLRAVLDILPGSADVVVAELIPEVVAWNRDRLGAAAGYPLADPRVRVEIRDVAKLLADAPARFDAILLDIDNGPHTPVRPANAPLFAPSGLSLIRGALRFTGILAVWSADSCEPFVHALRCSGFRARGVAVPARLRPEDPLHTIVLAARD
jgi:spermidine synthase